MRLTRANWDAWPDELCRSWVAVAGWFVIALSGGIAFAVQGVLHFGAVGHVGDGLFKAWSTGNNYFTVYPAAWYTAYMAKRALIGVPVGILILIIGAIAGRRAPHWYSKTRRHPRLIAVLWCGLILCAMLIAVAGSIFEWLYAPEWYIVEWISRHQLRF